MKAILTLLLLIVLTNLSL